MPLFLILKINLKSNIKCSVGALTSGYTHTEVTLLYLEKHKIAQVKKIKTQRNHQNKKSSMSGRFIAYEVPILEFDRYCFLKCISLGNASK
jgi:hypothetical protein